MVHWCIFLLRFEWEVFSIRVGSWCIFSDSWERRMDDFLSHVEDSFLNLLSCFLVSVALCGITVVLIFESMLHWRVWCVISLENYWIISLSLLLNNSSLLVSWYHSCCMCLLLIGVDHYYKVWCDGSIPFFGICNTVCNILFHVFHALFEGLDWHG